MRPIYLLWLVVPLAACQSSSMPFEPVSDPCKSLQYHSKVGMKFDELPGGTFPEAARIIHPDTMVTRDYRPERLNVHVNANGRVARLECG